MKILLVLYVAVIVKAELNISLYYETLCPDSLLFIRTQFYPTYKLLHKYFNTELIPYGFAIKTKKDNKRTFKCQHGPKECYGNKLEACVINQVPNQDQHMDFINCLSYNPNFDRMGQSCAKVANINWNSIHLCANNAIGDEYLARMGRKMLSLKPRSKWVPDIRFNGIENEQWEDEANVDFKKLMCKLLANPPECHHTMKTRIKFH